MFKKIVLPNGLRIVLVPQPSSLAATVAVFVEAGSEYEAKETNGISHFLEHLVFKGTTTRPKPGMIAAELESLGAEYNAMTGQEHTSYYAKAQSHKLPEITDLVSDMYLNPIFNPQEIEKERGVIVEEINLYEDTPSRKIHSLLTSLLYGDQPAGWDIAGEKSVVRRLEREDFVRYRADLYAMAATTVVVAGAFDSRKVISQVRKIFGGLPKGRKWKKERTVERQVRPQVLVKYKESDQSQIAFGIRAFDVFDERRYALQVMTEILGGGMSSRLWHRIREDLGAAYYVRAGEDLSADHGYMAVNAGVDIKKIEEVIRAVLEEFVRLTREPVSPLELRKAKDHMIGNLILSLETSDELAYFYGTQEVLTGSLRTVEELIRRVEKVSSAEVQRLAKTLFVNERLNLAVIGPFKKPDAFRKLLRLP